VLAPFLGTKRNIESSIHNNTVTYRFIYLKTEC
jgi:hypothetical protein